MKHIMPEKIVNSRNVFSEVKIVVVLINLIMRIADFQTKIKSIVVEDIQIETEIHEVMTSHGEETGFGLIVEVIDLGDPEVNQADILPEMTDEEATARETKTNQEDEVARTSHQMKR